MGFKVVLQPSEDGGFTAVVPAWPGCISEGGTKEEALRHIREAIGLYLAEADEELAPANRGEEVEV